jgi:hypothetical protein
LNFIQTLTDSAITLIPYILILIALLVCTGKILRKADASRLRVILVLLLTPHLLVWLPNYVYQWSLLELDHSFATSMGISILVELSLTLVFAIGLFRVVFFLQEVTHRAVDPE